MTKAITPVIEEGWKEILDKEFQQEYFKYLKKFLLEEKKTQIVYPKGSNMFASFNYTPFNKIKAVILGQDPYHGPNQANGLCFSVAEGIKPPPSLVNIFKELEADLGHKIPNSGNLEKWAKQGVLLLNSTLTVRESQPGSHQKKGWETFTDSVINNISNHKKNVVFILWGRFAQSKSALIDSSKHLILKAAHPSPFSAYNGFFGCKHFSQTNKFLAENSLTAIDWNLNNIG